MAGRKKTSTKSRFGGAWWSAGRLIVATAIAAVINGLIALASSAQPPPIEASVSPAREIAVGVLANAAFGDQAVVSANAPSGPMDIPVVQGALNVAGDATLAIGTLANARFGDAAHVTVGGMDPRADPRLSLADRILRETPPGELGRAALGRAVDLLIALDSRPFNRDEMVVFLQGFGQFRREELDAAAWTWRRACALAPGRGDFFLALGVVETKLARVSGNREHFASARAALEAASHLDPTAWLSHLHLGDLALNEGDFAAAIAPLRKGLALAEHDPAMAPRERALTHLKLGGAFAGLARYTEAEAELEVAVETDPQMLEARHSLVLMMAALRRGPEAVEPHLAILGAEAPELANRLRSQLGANAPQK